MKPCWHVRGALVVLLLAWAAGVGAQQISLTTLQRRLQEAPRQAMRFRETRESPWLAAPVESSGTLRSSATLLEKSVEEPRRETWRILPDRVELLAAGATTPKVLMFSAAPAVATLANTLRQVMTGDLQALDRDYHLELAGDERVWTVHLTPRLPDTARFLKEVELQGTGSQLRAIVILESQGERTVTRLTPEP